MSTFDKIRKEVIKMKYSDIKYLYKYVQDYIDYWRSDCLRDLEKLLK